MPRRYLAPSVFWSLRQGFPRWLSWMLSIAALVIPLLLWTFLSQTGWTNPVFLPSPLAVLQAGGELIQSGDLLLDVYASCYRVFWGFVAAAAIGIPLGIAMGTFHSMESLFGPIVGTVRYMPIVALVPLIIIWAGLGEMAKILIVLLGIVFFNAIMIADAVKFIPDEWLNVAYTLGANRWQVVRRVIVPAIVPSMIDTLRVNIAGAWNLLVVSELIAAENGLGFRIVQSQRFLQTDRVLFGIAVIGLIGLLTDYGFKLLARWITPWTERS
ncbi:MAG: ABC transporter permease [Leptolyngbyaceae cyanobacterium bins.59]|nr:ABC transporter permease [Leptolyngbyaceae cyanobacterium bins.59]